MPHCKYFIALLPPEPIYSEVYQLKEHFRDQFNCKAPMRSPPHITLHMPFQWKEEKENVLLNKLVHATKEKEFNVELNGFGAFPPKTIYISVTKSKGLMEFQQRLTELAKQELNLFNANGYNRPFNPHLTVAFRDLKKTLFPQAWQEFKDKPFSTSFKASSFWLLKHDGKKWFEFKEFQFSE